MGLYPVHLHKFPDIASLMSSSLFFFLFFDIAKMDITKPGVQNPHWDA